MSTPAEDRRAGPLITEARRMAQNPDMIPPDALLALAGELIGLALGRSSVAMVDTWLDCQQARVLAASEGR